MADVDILLAAYNGSKYICDQIFSIQKQSYSDWKLLISDDSSTDDTPEIIKHFAMHDSRIELISSDSRYGSAKDNFLHLLSKSNSDYTMFCDQDDVWLPDKISLTLQMMRKLEQNNSDVPLLVFTDMKVVDSELRTIASSFEMLSHIDYRRTAFPYLLAQSIGAGCTMMINRRARVLASRAIDASQIIMHDWWLSLICSAFGDIGYVGTPTSLYRQHGGNEVGAKNYSPFARLLQFESMRMSVRETIRQANHFYTTYSGELSQKQRFVLNQYIQSGNMRGLGSLFHLVRSGCWKKGLRKIGQILVAIRGC